ncbi:MAG: hypothetical protein ABIJ09_04900 [Pseudomonadota bacterium]
MRGLCVMLAVTCGVLVAACPSVDDSEPDSGAHSDAAARPDTAVHVDTGQDRSSATDTRTLPDTVQTVDASAADTRTLPDTAQPVDATADAAETVVTYGPTYQGGEFHLGPVDYQESVWHNACAPGSGYAPAIQQAQGTLLAGLWNGIPDVADACDTCVHIVTAMGKSAVLRVVTFGVTTTNSIDTSPEAYAVLDSGEYPRHMSWQFARCPDTGPLLYEFQTGSSEWWTSLWVRNARVPLHKVEVLSANHASYTALVRGSDGTLNDASGFGAGAFTLRLTGIDGQVVSDSFAWPASGIAGALLTGHGNFE